MGSLSVLTPISYKYFEQPTLFQKIEELNDRYLSLGHLRAYVIPEKTQDGTQQVHLNQNGTKLVHLNYEDYNTLSYVVCCAFKIASYASIIFPLIAIALKVVFRSINSYQFGLDCFKDMPPEMVCQIMGYLNGKDLMSCSRVSSSFHKVTQEKTFERKMIVPKLLACMAKNLTCVGLYRGEFDANPKDLLRALRVFERDIKHSSLSSKDKTSRINRIRHLEETLKTKTQVAARDLASLKLQVAIILVLISFRNIPRALEIIQESTPLCIDAFKAAHIVNPFISERNFSEAQNIINEIQNPVIKRGVQKELKAAEALEDIPKQKEDPALRKLIVIEKILACVIKIMNLEVPLF